MNPNHYEMYTALANSFENLGQQRISPGTIAMSSILVAAQFIAKAQNISSSEAKEQLIVALNKWEWSTRDNNV